MTNYIIALLLLIAGYLFLKIENEKKLQVAKNEAFKRDSVCYHIEIEYQKKDTFKWYNNNRKMLPKGDRETIYLSKEDYINLNK